MLIIFLMAGKTGCVSALEYIIDVTFAAFNIGMLAFQLKGRKVMIKSGRFPTGGLVASTTILPKLSFMFVILLMAGIAGSFSAFEYTIDMTFGAFHINMFTFQLESGQVVIKSSGFPPRGAVA